MGLCPSNLIAAENNPGKTPFRNLARRTKAWHNNLQIEVDVPNIREIHAEVDGCIRAELLAAGVITPTMLTKIENSTESDFILVKGDVREYVSMESSRKREVPSSITTFAYHWKFGRNWYYWVAEGPGVPPVIAEEFHQKWGTQVRVGGDCGCPSPIESYHGFAVGSYHIDTAEGLKAFVELLASIYIPRESK